MLKKRSPSLSGLLSSMRCYSVWLVLISLQKYSMPREVMLLLLRLRCMRLIEILFLP